jgi:hypothetical protein
MDDAMGVAEDLGVFVSIFLSFSLLAFRRSKYWMASKASWKHHSMSFSTSHF